MMSLSLSAAFVAAIVLVAGATRSNADPKTAAGTIQYVGNAPRFAVDPTWPQQLPFGWYINEGGGLSVDSQGDIWEYHRPSDNSTQEQYAAESPPVGDCCFPAPPVLEFNSAGVLINAWGPVEGSLTSATCTTDGPGNGTNPYPSTNSGAGGCYDAAKNASVGEPALGSYPGPYTAPSTSNFVWFANGGEHGINATDDGYVWVGSNGGSSAQFLKFTRNGTFVLRVGVERTVANSTVPCPDNLSTLYECEDAQFFVDVPNNEIYVADGYSDSRVSVWDATTGLFKRSVGSYGVSDPLAGVPCQVNPSVPGSPTPPPCPAGSVYNGSVTTTGYGPVSYASPSAYACNINYSGAATQTTGPGTATATYGKGTYFGIESAVSGGPVTGGGWILPLQHAYTSNGLSTGGTACPGFTGGTYTGSGFNPPAPSNEITPPNSSFYARSPVHCVTQDPVTGYIWMCDRTNNHIEVFTPGTGWCAANARQTGQAACVAQKGAQPMKYLGQCYFLQYTLGNSGSSAGLTFYPRAEYPHGAKNEMLIVNDLSNMELREVLPIPDPGSGPGPYYPGAQTATEGTPGAKYCPLQGQFGWAGREAGEFHWIHVAQADAQGNIYTTEVDTGRRVQKFVPH